LIDFLHDDNNVFQVARAFTTIVLQQAAEEYMQMYVPQAC